METNSPAWKWKTVIKAQNKAFDIQWRQLWDARDLIMMFVWRDFVAVYKQTILGPLWHVLQPLLTACTYAVVFGKMAGMSTNGSPTLLFYLTGTILWTYFSNCLVNTANTFVANTHLFGKVYFPRLAIPISVVISNLIAFGIQAFVTGIIMIIYTFLDAQFQLTLGLLLTPLLLIIVAVMGLGFGLIVAALTTRYRDLAHLVRFGTQLLMFATPVIYPTANVPEKYQWVVQLNPMAPVFEAFRYGALGRGTISWIYLFYSMGATLITVTFGLWLFSKVEKTFMDTV